MRKILFTLPLMAAGFAATGCGSGGKHTLSIALDSDTIVIDQPVKEEPELIPVVADSDSLPKVLHEDSIQKAAKRGDLTWHNRLSANGFMVALLALLLLTACSSQPRQYTIGVSQCSEDIWRDKQNAELRMGAYFHEGVTLHFASAYDSDQRQIEQIDSLVALGIDLLIVAPNQVATISPAIDRAYDQGIPVIVFERKTNSKKYTAYMGADNYEMGRLMGEYIASRLNGRGRVMEIMGLKGSSPAIERHKGFADAMKEHPGIEVVATLQGDWTEQSAYNSSLLTTPLGEEQIDFVFAQNDCMAIGARRAIMERRGMASAQKGTGTGGAMPATTQQAKAALPRFCGIDGLPGEGGGLQLVRDSVLDATYIYPTHGDRLLQLAVDILDENPYKKETALRSALVTHENANVLLMQYEEMQHQGEYLDQLHERADTYLQQLDSQRTITLLAIGLIVLLVAAIISIYLYFLQRARLHRERTKMEHEQLDFYTQVAHELRTPLTLIEGPLAQLAETRDVKEAGAEVSGLFAILQRNTHQLTDLINKMLNMQARGSAELKSGEMRTESGEFATALQTSIDSRAEANSTPSTPNSQLQALNAQLDTSTVLIVDDNADIRAYLRTILQDRYQVNEAADGQQGLTLANEIVPDLIVSDVMMPVMNGLEFCQRVKSGTATSHIPVILLTARALSQHQVEGYESGADAYITKPFSAEVLLARIGNLLKSRRQLKNLFSSVEGRVDSGELNSLELRTESVESATALQTSVDSRAVANSEPSTLNSQLKEDSFLLKFRDFIQANMADSDLSVETIGAELGLSRVQLYRKVKALTGQSPVELLRKARLQKGRQLLETSEKNISEVAYEVGFSAPSYFTKCFKDEFGISPSDL